MNFKISDSELWYKINDKFSNKGGVYKVIATRKGDPISITRLLESDTEGVLYIGKAISFLDRVINLKKSTDPEYESSSHEFGVRYKQHKRLKEIFPYNQLFINLTLSENPLELEKSELIKYYEKFGELPPLNRQE